MTNLPINSTETIADHNPQHAQGHALPTSLLNAWIIVQTSLLTTTRYHPYLTIINIPFITTLVLTTLVLYLSMTLFRKLRLNRIRLQISNLASHTSHPPKTRRLRSAPTTHFYSARISITHSTSNSPPPDPQHSPRLEHVY